MIQLNDALIPVIERLARIESKLEGKQVPKLMTIKDIMSYYFTSFHNILHYVLYTIFRNNHTQIHTTGDA